MCRRDFSLQKRRDSGAENVWATDLAERFHWEVETLLEWVRRKTCESSLTKSQYKRLMFIIMLPHFEWCKYYLDNPSFPCIQMSVPRLRCTLLAKNKEEISPYRSSFWQVKLIVSSTGRPCPPARRWTDPALLAIWGRVQTLEQNIKLVAGGKPVQ